VLEGVAEQAVWEEAQTLQAAAWAWMGAALQTAREMPVARAEEEKILGEAWLRTLAWMEAEVRPARDSWAFAGLRAE
jgi:hypothetical protein